MLLSNEKGFTLVELIIVLSIITIISFITLPKVNIVERYKLKSTAYAVAEDLKYTQKLAINENITHHFKTTNDLYFIRKDGVSIGSTKKVYIPNDIKFENTSKDISYTSKGTPVLGGAITLSSRNYKIQITVIPATGRITVYEILKK